MTDREQNLIAAADAVAKTGKPRLLRWKGVALRIGPPPKPTRPAVRKLTAAQKKRKEWLDSPHKRGGIILCDPEELVHMDWSAYWNPDPH